MTNIKVFRNIIDKIIEKLFTISGAVTSITILLITLFLFKEGIGLFHTPEVERGYKVFVNSQNGVEELSSLKLKEIFDSEITNWRDVGGKDLDIKIFRIDDVFRLYSESEFGENYELLPQKLNEIISKEDGIIAFLPIQYAPESPDVKELLSKNINAKDYFFGKEWIPTATPAPLFGVLPLVLGTLLVSIMALVMAVPLGLGVAIYLSELAGENQRKLMKPIIELLAGIPSVVYGFFGLVVIVPFVQKTLQIPVGETAFTGSVVLAIMSLPTIISVAEDAMRNTPRSMREASLALGATKWQTVYKVIIPYAKSGISAAVVLGIGRAIGETMAVMMVTGNAAVIPVSIFESVRTIPATIAAELGEAPTGDAHYQALFLLGCILFVFTMIISISAEFISKKQYNKAS
ncbi:MAG: phosphate ABC transporter permease subunit PstC [Bacteroidales bacterium 36-12]|nr:MAG: phosphate ABC transporter permease subunit PstC [Bacteroidales bacterium 36-12]